jgi:hypothetical protein
VAVLMPMASTSEHSLSSIVRKAHEDSRMPEDELFWQMLQSIASVVDKIESTQAGYGPGAAQEAAKYAAHAANQTVSRYMKPLSRRLGLLDTLGILLLCAITGIASWHIRGQMLQSTPIGPMPAEMTKDMQYQDWGVQFAACRPQPKINGFEWCLLPFITHVPESPAAMKR